MTAFVHRKYKIYFFYGVIICDKYSSIVNIKNGIIYNDWRKTVETINTCDDFCVSKIQKKYFFYGVIICDKHSFIVSIKVGIIYNDQRKTIRTINTCDGFCALKIQNIHFLWCYYLWQKFFHRKYKKMVLVTAMKSSKMVKYFGGKIPSLLFTFLMTFIHCN